MRKGSVHIDWAMSMGIFLVSLIAIFVFLKPGAKEESKGDVLLDLIQNSLEKNISTKAERIPLIVEKLDSGAAQSEEKPEINIHPVSSGWSMTKFDNLKTPPFEQADIDDNAFKLKCNFGVCSTKNNDGEHEPIMITFFKSSSGENELNINEDICGHAPDDKCEASLGVAETLEGISTTWMNTLFSSSEYERIKAEWGVPLNRDFAIYHDDERLFGIGAPENGNVFTRNLMYWALNSDGARDKYELRLQTW